MKDSHQTHHCVKSIANGACGVYMYSGMGLVVIKIVMDLGDRGGRSSSLHLAHHVDIVIPRCIDTTTKSHNMSRSSGGVVVAGCTLIAVFFSLF